MRRRGGRGCRGGRDVFVFGWWRYHLFVVDGYSHRRCFEYLAARLRCLHIHSSSSWLLTDTTSQCHGATAYKHTLPVTYHTEVDRSSARNKSQTATIKPHAPYHHFRTKIFTLTSHVHFACITSSSYTPSGILGTKLTAKFLIVFACSGGKERRIFVGLCVRRQCMPCFFP